MGKLLCLGFVLVSACQPLYGDPPERPHTPEVKPHKDVIEAPPPVAYVDKCDVQFQDDPKKWHPQPPAAKPIIDSGDAASAEADKATDEKVKVSYERTAVDKYRSALIKDPYNADATLKLALAYDKVLRRGCALAMLKRLASLTNNPKFAVDASHSIAAVDDNAAWFKNYRDDALKAVGH
ncbi:MAG: hypothetical protein QM831_05950 [Kofleriaceae bacterium]